MEEIFKAYNAFVIALESQGESCEHILIRMAVIGDMLMELDEANHKHGAD